MRPGLYTTIPYKETAWKRIDDGRTIQMISKSPQTFGLGPKHYNKTSYKISECNVNIYSISRVHISGHTSASRFSRVNAVKDDSRARADVGLMEFYTVSKSINLTHIKLRSY